MNIQEACFSQLTPYLDYADDSIDVALSARLVQARELATSKNCMTKSVKGKKSENT